MKRYSEYKDSGVEWLGEVPKHWNYLRGDSFLILNKNQISANELNGKQVLHYSIPSIQTFGDAQIEDGKTVDSNKFVIQGNEILYSKLNPRKETICISKENKDYLLIASTEFLVLTCNESEVLLKYVFYLLKSDASKQRICSKVQSATRSHQRVNPSDVHKLWHFVPSIIEQKSIATYLDQKTTRIDFLIENKRQMVELLREERAAIINHAVTKGINPDAERKDSGVEWLGDVPKHWEVKRLKYLSHIRYGLGQPPKLQDNGLPMIRATNVDHGKIVEKDLIFVAPEDVPVERDPYLQEGDIIVVRSGAYTADSAIIPAPYAGAIAGYDMVVTAIKLNCYFLAHCLLSQYVQKYQMDLHKLRAAQPHLNAEDLGDIIIIVPPLKEQEKIVLYINNKMENIDKAVSMALKESSLIEEYRTALINETVTGKIDIRDKVKG